MLADKRDQIFSGTLLIIAPHMDDEALACGGLIAGLPQKERIYIVYATDGMKSPAPIIPGSDVISSDLGEVRGKESIKAMTFLGIPEENLHFLRLPEGQLRKNRAALRGLLLEQIKKINPEYIFIPFRYDRHPDHIVINHVITQSLQHGCYVAQLVEYFVYHRWRLLPKKDIRAYIKPDCLLKMDITNVSKKKRLALDYYQSQTTIYYPWQTRPVLTSSLLDEESANEEYFLMHRLSMPGASVFTQDVLWIKIAHVIEPIIKDARYFTTAFVKRALRSTAHNG